MGLAQPQRLQANEIATCLAQGNDEKLWEDAKRSFMEKNRPKKETGSEAEAFAVFIGKSESVGEMRKLCSEVQKSADAKYTTSDLKIKGKTILPGTWLKSTLAAMDMFISVGDVAFKGGAESVALGWTAVKWILNAVRQDSERCAQWAEASEMISRILLTCRTIGKMYSSAKSTEPTELVQQLLKDIPTVYESILAYSWAARKQVERSAARRMLSGVNPLSSAANASKGAFEQIKQYYQRIREDGQTAFHEAASKALESIDEGQKDVLLTIRESFDASQKQMQSFSDSNREVLDEVKKLRPLTPYQSELKKFEEYKIKLEPSEHSSRLKTLKIQSREPGTCTWIFESEEYKTWYSAESSQLLRVSGHSGFGKSVLTSTVIERLRDEAKSDDTKVVAYWYCVNSGSTDGTQKSTRLVQDVIYRLYEHAAKHQDALTDFNRLFTKNEGKDGKDKKEQDTSMQGNRRVRKTVDFLGNPDETFVSLAKILGHQVFVVIDALDECVDRLEEEFFDTLQNWVRDSGTKVKIFVSSRPEQDIVNKMEQFPSIDLAQRNRDDLARRTDSALTEFPTLSPSEKKRIRDTMLEKAEGQFTYIELAIRILNQPWVRPIDKLIAKFQDGVARLYQETLRSTDPNYKDLAYQALTWTLLKQDDLSISDFFDIYSRRYTAEDAGAEEVEEVTGTDENKEDQPEDNADAGGKEAESSEEVEESAEEEVSFQYGKRSEANISLYLKQIERAARTFVRITASETLQEQHQNVRECFLRDDTNGTDPQGFYIDREQGHLAITLELLKALNSDAFAKDYMPPTSYEETAASATVSDDPSGENPWLIWKFKDVPVEEGEPERGEGDEKKEGESSDVASDGPDSTTESSGTSSGADQSIATSQTSVESAPEAIKDADEAAKASEEQEGEASNEPDGSIEQEAPAEEEEDLYANDSDSGDIDDSLDLEQASDSVETSQPVKRYEVWNWYRHLKCAEQAAGPDSPKRGGLWEEVWLELRKFLLNKVKFRAWCQAYDETKGDGWSQWTINSAASPDMKFTPMHILAGCGNTWALRRMIEEGADFQVANAFNDLPAVCVSLDPTMNEDLDLIELLLTHCNINERDPDEQGQDYTFNYCLWSDPSEAVVRKMVDMGARPDVRGYMQRSALHYVANVGTQPDVARYFISKGLNVNALDEDGNTPLHLLLQRSDIDDEMLDVFLSSGANVRQESNASEQPLVGAAISGQLKAVQLLLKEGPGRSTADVHDEDDSGKTALHMAAYNGHTEIVRCLLEHGADINHKSLKHSTPLFNASEGKHADTALLLLEKLLESNTPAEEIDQARVNGKTVVRQAALSGALEILQHLLDSPGVAARVNLYDDNSGWTPLHVASLMAHDKVVELLLEKGAYTTADKRGKTPLQLCCERWSNGIGDSARNERHEAIALMLLNNAPESATAEPNALFTAAAMGSHKLTKRLLELDANPNVVDDHGWKPVHVARYNGHTTIVSLLDHGGVFGRAPSHLIPPKDQTTITYDESTNTYTATEPESERLTLVADHPVRVGEHTFYYEVTLQSPHEDAKEGVPAAAVGLAQKPSRTKDWLPGWWQLGGRSYGWHADDGKLFENTMNSGTGGDREGFEPYGYGDTIGCGWDVQKSVIFYTRNGALLGVAFQAVSGRLFPCVGVQGEVALKVDFKGPWVYGAMNGISRRSTEILQEEKSGSVESEGNESENVAETGEMGAVQSATTATGDPKVTNKTSVVEPDGRIEHLETDVKKQVGEAGEDKLRIGVQFEVAT